jgi:hypothetical protein
VKEENLMYPSGIELILTPAKLGDVAIANRASRKAPELDVGIASAGNRNSHWRPS